jgi:hypothetical protein
MADKIVVSTLIEKRARLAGDLIVAKRRVIEIRQSLIHVDACLRMLKDGFEPRSIRPKRTTGKNPAGLAKGQGARTALDILRETGERLDSTELARRVLERLGKEVSPKAVHMLAVTLQSTFSRHRTDIVGFDRSTYPGRWFLIPR